LYAIGVVTSFVLAQAGMTKHHLVEREPGWRHGLVVNGFGALVTSSEVAMLEVDVSETLASPKPCHEVVVLIELLDRATLAALQYARQLNPLSITAVHIAVDPDAARELARRWSKVPIPISLEVIDAPDRNLLATVEETVVQRIRPDTEVTVLIPRRRRAKLWYRILHDRTAEGVFRVLSELDNVNVTIIPYRLRPRPPRPVAAEHVRAHAGG
jgi:hypothetical protein